MIRRREETVAYFGTTGLYEAAISKWLYIERRTRVPSGEKMVVRPGDPFRRDFHANSY